jgi:Uma2 family endonuclease
MSLVGYLWTYLCKTPGIRGGDNSSVRLDPVNELQPDGILFIPGAGAVIDKDDYVAGAPELVAEVAGSTIGIDLGKKKQVYARNGVKEYLLWRVEDAAMDWFILRAGQYEPMPLHDGIFRSEAFPGLWLDTQALLRGDFARVHEILEQGLKSREHASFVAGFATKTE